MSIEELATFVEAVNEGSMAGASRVLGVPTSTVSRRIHRLEVELGAQLVDAHSRLFRLTEVGEQLYRHTASAVRDLREATHAVRDGSDATLGQLRLSAPQDLGSSPLLADLVADFRRAHPGIELLMDLTDRRVDLVAEGVDFAFRIHPGPVSGHASLMTRRLANLDSGLFASPRYLEERGTPEHPSDLHGHVLVLPDLGVPIMMGDGHDQLVLDDFPSPVRSTSMGFMLPAATRGLGVAPIPSLLAQHEVNRGGLVHVLPDWHLQGLAMSLLWPASRLPTPRRRAFLDFVSSFPPLLMDGTAHSATMTTGAGPGS